MTEKVDLEQSLDSLDKTVKEVVRERAETDTAIRLVLEGFDKGVFVRDVSHDHESGWAVRQLPYLTALGHLARLLEDRRRDG